MLPDELRHAANLIRTGRSSEARPILARHLQQHPESEQGWLLLSMVLRERSQRIDCLERVLKINPENGLARERLSQMQSARPAAPATPSQPQPAAAAGQKPQAQPKPTPPAARPGADLSGQAKPEKPGVPIKGRPKPAAQPRKTPEAAQLPQWPSRRSAGAAC
ncbi:MAG: hypothetical protein NTU91_04175 [Chloroflexi bacterium]|nr:hypothetical protein [Chloroflexota bacterium]